MVTQGAVQGEYFDVRTCIVDFAILPLKSQQIDQDNALFHVGIGALLLSNRTNEECRQCADQGKTLQ